MCIIFEMCEFSCVLMCMHALTVFDKLQPNCLGRMLGMQTFVGNSVEVLLLYSRQMSLACFDQGMFLSFYADIIVAAFKLANNEFTQENNLYIKMLHLLAFCYVIHDCLLYLFLQERHVTAS